MTMISIKNKYSKKFTGLVGKRAVAMIEFAVALPMFILFLIVLIDAGRYFDVYFRLSTVAWNGVRFFSSLSEPQVACFDDSTPHITTTNLMEVPSSTYTDDTSRGIYDTHKIVHERIKFLFHVKGSSWPLVSDEIIPDLSPGNVKLSDVITTPPSVTIKTQYIGALTGASSILNTRCSPVPTAAELENTVAVCLSSKYQGFFFGIPIKICSYAFLLVNNESTYTPSNANVGNSSYGINS